MGSSGLRQADGLEGNNTQLLAATKHCALVTKHTKNGKGFLKKTHLLRGPS
jgi:hypothetical protein